MDLLLWSHSGPNGDNSCFGGRHILQIRTNRFVSSFNMRSLEWDSKFVFRDKYKQDVFLVRSFDLTKRSNGKHHM
jgi:hypothetical protein